MPERSGPLSHATLAVVPRQSCILSHDTSCAWQCISACKMCPDMLSNMHCTCWFICCSTMLWFMRFVGAWGSCAVPGFTARRGLGGGEGRSPYCRSHAFRFSPAEATRPSGVLLQWLQMMRKQQSHYMAPVNTQCNGPDVQPCTSTAVKPHFTKQAAEHCKAP